MNRRGTAWLYLACRIDCTYAAKTNVASPVLKPRLAGIGEPIRTYCGFDMREWREQGIAVPAEAARLAPIGVLVTPTGIEPVFSP
jgi:hypothetical protein